MDYWCYDKRDYPPQMHTSGVANDVQLSERRLRVLVLGGEGVYDLFYSILVANIRRWGYEAQLLSPTQIGDSQRWQELEGDILLYDMDGSLQPVSALNTVVSEETARELADAAFARKRPRTRLVMALGSRSISRHSLERIGAITFLHKPFDMRYLERYLRVFQRLLYGEGEQHPIGGEISSLPVLSGRVHRLLTSEGEPGEEVPLLSEQATRILLADDRQEITGEIHRRLLERKAPAEYYEVKEVHDGLSLLEHCLSWRPHCVVTDLLMPWLDGYEVIRCLVSNARQPVPAFVVVSALPQRKIPGDQGLFQDKAVLYIDKPFDVEDLLALIERALAQ